MIAVYLREIRAYFTSAMGYIFLACMLFFSGYFFMVINLENSYADMGPFFNNVSLVLLFLVPILTMRLIADEKKSKTDQMLMTAPIRTLDFVLGKYLAAASLFLLSILIMMIYAIILFIFGKPSAGELFAMYINYFLMGSALISIGLFISAMTESQIVASFTTFTVLLVLWLMTAFAAFIPNKVVYDMINWLSVLSRYAEFSTDGVLNILHLFYYISFSAVFVFLTVMVLERKRWS